MATQKIDIDGLLRAGSARVGSARLGVLALAACCGVFCVGNHALAQEADAPQPILDIRFAGIEGITPAPKDRMVYEVLPMLGERLIDLPVEIAGIDGGDPIDAAFVARGVDLAWSAFTGAFGLSVAPGVGPFGFGAAVWADPSGDMTPLELTDGIADFLEPGGITVTRGDDTVEFATPFGPTPVRTVGGDTLFAQLGLPDAEPQTVQRFDLPRGAEPVLSMHVNLREITAPLGPLLQAGDPAMRQQLVDGGVIGPDAMLMDIAVGTDERSLHATTRFRDAKRLFTRLGQGPEHAFTSRDLRVVPRDATVLSATPLSLTQLSQARAAIAAAGGEDPLAEIEDSLGIDIEGDFLSNLGPRFIYYQSETTGGGGFLSAVAIVELRDAERFERAVERLAGFGNDLAQSEAFGYVRVGEREVAGERLMTVSFPGLPVPLELAWAVRDDRLVVAASPSGLVAALQQIENPRDNIVRSASFARVVGQRMPADGAGTIYYVDNERFARQGYGLVNLGMSAVSNLVRNPAEPADRTPGLLMPGYAEFMKGIEPMGAVMTWDGDDYVLHLMTDRSVLVNASVLAAQYGAVLPALGAMTSAATLPALGQARRSARQLKSSTQVRAIVQAAIIWSADNDDQMPPSLEALVEAGYLSEEILVSPMEPAWDGGPDYGFVGGINDFDASRIVAIDRAAYLNGGSVAVGFADGHVRMMPTWELDDLLEQAPNDEVRAKLGIE